MRKIKQIDRPFAVTRTMPYGENLYSVYVTETAAKAALEKLPRKQMPAWVKFRKHGNWEILVTRTA